MRLSANLLAMVMLVGTLTSGVLAASPTESAAQANEGGAQEGEGELSDLTFAELSQLEAAAVLEFDAWTISDLELQQQRLVVERNVSMQELQVPVAERELNRLMLLESGAQATLEFAQISRDDALDLYRSLAVGLFVSGHDVYTPQFGAEADRLHLVETIDAISDDYAATYFEAEESLSDAAEALAERSADVEDGQAVLAAAEAMVEEAERLLEEFDRLAEERDQMIADRIRQAVADYDAGSNLVTVEGYRVDASLAEPLTALITAAREDGINFGGWGWRSRADQINLRIAHCGDSGYAIFEMSASSCIPPTARPGASQHELGLAIDFTENGSILTWGSAGFAWLQEHAADYGLYNLPSEAWHWSTTGG